jgi:hypothetical protein
MHLYSLTLQKASGITAAVFGNFSAPKQQELIVARGKILELMRPDDNGKVQTVHATEVFGIIRSIATFRLTGERRHHTWLPVAILSSCQSTHHRRECAPHRWQQGLRCGGIGLWQDRHRRVLG